MFAPDLSVLPGPQRQLWAELGSTPKAFVLYGGTALALRLGHRQDPDFAEENGVQIASMLDLLASKWRISIFL